MGLTAVGGTLTVVGGSSPDLGDSSPDLGTWVRTESDDPSIVKAGTWSTAAVAGASGGSLLYGSGTSQRLTLEFTGTGGRIIVMKRPNSGIAGVYLNSVLVDTIDTYAPEIEDQAVGFEITGLAPDEYTLGIQPTNTKNPEASNSNVFVDAFEALT